MLRRAAPISAALHLLVLGFLLFWFARQAGPQLATPQEPPTVELVIRTQQGTGKTTAAGTAGQQPDAKSPPTPQATAVPPPPQPTTAPPTPQAPPPPSSEPQTAAVPAPPMISTPPQANAVPLPPPPPQAPPPVAPPRPAPPPATPPVPAQQATTKATPAPSPPSPQPGPDVQMNLGGTASLSNTFASGDQIIPAKTDATFHNKEPVYPLEAARRGQQGVVILVVQVSAEGLASAVNVQQSSGYPLLDRAAVDAVSTWRFNAAIRDGQQVPSQMPLRIMFQID